MRHPCLTWWPEKFFGDTAHVSPDAAAFYMVLLSHAWMRGGSLPNDDAALRNMTRLSRQKWSAIREQVMSFWTLGEDNRWHQKRLDEEWSKASERRVEVQRASHKVDEHNGKTRDRLKAQKSNEIKETKQNSARAHDPTPTPTQKNSLVPSESSSGARAPLCVRPHATPALRLVGNDEHVPQVDDRPSVDEAGIAEGLARLAASISGVKNLDSLDEAIGGTKAELAQQNALQKLNQLASAEKSVLALSPIAKASPLVAAHEGDEANGKNAVTIGEYGKPG
jgi:uncharacterized protein YdaU (DUF1376 family)